LSFVGEREAQEQTCQEVLALERKITQKWHRLLIRNASYAREAELWYVYQEKSIPLIQKSLDAETILLEFFIAQQEIIVFLVTTSTIKALSLPTTIAQGYMLEYPIAKFYLDVRVNPIHGGTNEIMKEIIGRSLGF
jgi:alkylation response protein AidB-like acyl-CoA dehydrogenase